MVWARGRWPKASPRAAAWIALLFAAAIALTAGYGLYDGMRRSREASQMVRHTHEVLENIATAGENAALLDAVEVRHGQAGANVIAASRRSALEGLRRAASNLVGLTDGNPEQHRRALRLVAIAASAEPTRDVADVSRDMRRAELALLSGRQAEDEAQEGHLVLRLLLVVLALGCLLGPAYWAVMSEMARGARLEKRLGELLANLPLTAWEMERLPDGRGVFTYVGRHCMRDRGISGKALRSDGNAALSNIHPDDRPPLMAAVRRAESAGGELEATYRVFMPDGRTRWVRTRASFHRDVGRPRWTGYWADQTRDVRLQEEMKALNRELEAFSYSVSHDLRSPLAAVDGFSRALQERAGALDEKSRHYLARIRAGVEQMGDLIAGLLHLSTVARAEMRMVRVDVSRVAREVAQELADVFPGRSVQLHVADGLFAQGDPRLLRQVFANLLGNSWKFTSGTPMAKIEVGAGAPRDGLASFFVRDNGAGFDMSYADRLFEPFQRLHGQAEFEGTGIGLATVKRIVGRHGGMLWAESAPGAGATISFTLPAPLPA